MVSCLCRDEHKTEVIRRFTFGVCNASGAASLKASSELRDRQALWLLLSGALAVPGH